MNIKRTFVLLMITTTLVFSDDVNSEDWVLHFDETEDDDVGFRYGQIDENHCTTPTGALGKCIFLKKCQSLMTLLKNNRNNPNSRRLLLDSKCGGQGKKVMVCCPDQPNTIIRASQASNNKPTELPSSPYCGNPEVIDAVKIHGGHPATLGEWPWIAALGYKNLTHSGPMWGCGGSIINTRYILTAAHCIKEPSLKLCIIRVGDLDLANNTDGATPMDFGFEHTIAHEGYRSGRKKDDVGLIKLDKDIVFSRNIKPICIPKPAQVRLKNYDGYFPFVIGWGAVNAEITHSDHLLQAQVPVVPNGQCRRLFTNIFVNILPSHICAGYLDGRADACMGDSGGPLMYPEGKTYYIIGIVSFGMKCGSKGYPGVYTRVTEYINWIESKISS